MKRYCCTTCGSTHVYADAWVALNEGDEDMVFDAQHCDECGGECRTELREVEDEE